MYNIDRFVCKDNLPNTIYYKCTHGDVVDKNQNTHMLVYTKCHLFSRYMSCCPCTNQNDHMGCTLRETRLSYPLSKSLFTSFPSKTTYCNHLNHHQSSE